MTASRKDQYFVLGILSIIVGVALAIYGSGAAIVPVLIGMGIILWSRGHLREYGLTWDSEVSSAPVEGAFCPYCGKEHKGKSGVRFCPFCGKDL